MAACCAALALLAAGPVVEALDSGSQAATQAASQPTPQTSPGLSIKPPAQSYAITPKRRALLNTIRYAEGTWKQGSREGYHTLYGGGRFASLARHPEIVVTKRYTSAAAGAYQFLPTTWKEASRKLQLESFDPASQDQAALYLIDRRGVLASIDNRGLTTESMATLAKEWASFPTLAGVSAYGQPVKRAEDLTRFYRESLNRAGDPA
jgi:lysozyme